MPDDVTAISVAECGCDSVLTVSSLWHPALSYFVATSLSFRMCIKVIDSPLFSDVLRAFTAKATSTVMRPWVSLSSGLSRGPPLDRPLF
jgi:hypothetical protein